MPLLAEDDFWGAAAHAFDGEALELTILPTERCNLNCVYCYETFQLGKMKSEVVRSVTRLIARRGPHLRRLAIDWFGGEPLLAMDVIEEIASAAQAAAGDNPHLDYSSSATTNGVLLTADRARKLAALGVRTLHVSLDGPAEAHDETRVNKKGEGTFAGLHDNLVAIRDSDIDVRIKLRVHVTQRNHQLLRGFTDELIETFVPDKRFDIYYFPIVDLGGPKQGELKVLSNQEANAVITRLSEQLAAARERLGVYPDKEPNKWSCKSAYVCYAAKANAWVIRSNGRLAKCTVGFEDERNDVGRLTPGGEFELQEDRLPVWMRGWESRDKLSLHCPYEGLRNDVAIGQVEGRA